MNQNLNDLGKSMFQSSLPCNAVPFLNGLIQGVKENGQDWIKTKEAKRILFIINSLAYSSLATIDMMDEFSNLIKN